MWGAMVEPIQDGCHAFLQREPQERDERLRQMLILDNRSVRNSAACSVQHQLALIMAYEWIALSWLWKSVIRSVARP